MKFLAIQAIFLFSLALPFPQKNPRAIWSMPNYHPVTMVLVPPGQSDWSLDLLFHPVAMTQPHGSNAFRSRLCLFPHAVVQREGWEWNTMAEDPVWLLPWQLAVAWSSSVDAEWYPPVANKFCIPLFLHSTFPTNIYQTPNMYPRLCHPEESIYFCVCWKMLLNLTKISIDRNPVHNDIDIYKKSEVPPFLTTTPCKN